MIRLLIGCCLAVAASGAWAQECAVNDPTGTPLNVRSRPNGAILGALHNGSRLQILDVTYDVNGKPWAYVDPLGPGKRGWVFRDYLACD